MPEVKVDERFGKVDQTALTNPAVMMPTTAIPDSKVVILIPVYNEARFIGSIVLQARDYGMVVVIDDGSVDQSAPIALRAGAAVLWHETNRGKGAALNTGFKYARSLSADVIVTLDGDGQHLCSDIPRLIAPILCGEADIAVGSRFLGHKNRIPAWRIFGQHALTLATNLSSGSHLTDSQSGFRAFSPKALSGLNFDTLDFSVESEMQFVARDRGLRVAEVPISVLYEDPPKRNPFSQGMQVINGIFRLVSNRRPLFFFGIGGLVLLLAGVIWSGYVVDVFLHKHILPIGYALISVLLILTGSSSFFTGLMLHSVRGLVSEIKRSIDRLQE